MLDPSLEDNLKSLGMCSFRRKSNAIDPPTLRTTPVLRASSFLTLLFISSDILPFCLSSSCLNFCALISWNLRTVLDNYKSQTVRNSPGGIRSLHLTQSG